MRRDGALNGSPFASQGSPAPKKRDAAGVFPPGGCPLAYGNDLPPEFIHTLSHDSEALMHPVHEFLEFCDHVRANDDHECWSMTWLDTLREGRSLVLHLAVDTGQSECPNQIWEVGSRDTRGFSLVDFDLTEWTLADDHVLLWDFTEPFNQLNFRAAHKRHDEVLWKLYERHRAVAWPWIRSERYINPAVLDRCLSSGSGVLADDRSDCSGSMPRYSRKTASSPIFRTPPGRRIDGMKIIVAGSRTKRISRFWSWGEVPM